MRIDEKTTTAIDHVNLLLQKYHKDEFIEHITYDNEYGYYHFSVLRIANISLGEYQIQNKWFMCHYELICPPSLIVETILTGTSQQIGIKRTIDSSYIDAPMKREQFELLSLSPGKTYDQPPIGKTYSHPRIYPVYDYDTHRKQSVLHTNCFRILDKAETIEVLKKAIEIKRNKEDKLRQQTFAAIMAENAAKRDNDTIAQEDIDKLISEL